MQTLPHLQEEIALWNNGYTVIGIDEVGRGAFAGPVYVSAVAFTPTTDLQEITRLCTLGINDSKKLSPAKRKALSETLLTKNILHATASTDCDTINAKGIMHALNSAILQVTQELSAKIPQQKAFVLLDGTHDPYKNTPDNISYRNIIKGDGISLSIAAASIIAKVTRDTYMSELAKKFPIYGWQKNKGYGTADHRQAIQTHGPCNHHRTLYIKKYL